MALAFVISVAALTLPGAANSASAQSAESITVRHSGKCLGVEAASNAHGANVQQQDCSGATNQSWTAVDVGGGYVQLKVAHSGLCLNVFGADTANLARLIQWPCVSATNEQFRVETVDGDWARVVARHSGRCLDIEGGSAVNGAQVIQFDCHGGTNQQFSVGPANVEAGVDGQWTGVINTPLVPVAASSLPDGKVLMWASSERFAIGPGNRGYTETMLFDPATSAYSERRVSNTGHDMFCPGISNLADGRVLVNGGSASGKTSIYNPATDSWENAADMNIPRAYQGTTLLSDGSAFTLGGSWAGGLGNKTAEVWTDGVGWRTKSGVPADPFIGPDPRGIYRADNHMWLFGWKNETVFHAGPSRAMHWIDTGGNGSYSNAGNRGNDGYAMNGNAVMYEPGKILTVGGATAYDSGQATSNATVIDLNGPTVTSRTVAPMANRRGFHSSVVLPNGEVVVTGGQEVTAAFSDDRSILATEIWNPETETFRTAAPMAVPRNYHSIGLLLADGKVLVGGGGLCGSCDTNHADVQIYSPPYLFDEDGSQAARPRIISAPSSVDLSEVFEVTTNTAVADFSLVRMASATHAVNNDQRRIPIEFTPGAGNLAYDLRTPSEGGVAIPGAYMLFAMDSAGVPSVAAVVTVTTDQAPADNSAPTVSFDFADGAQEPVGFSITGSVSDDASSIAAVEFAIKRRDTGQWVDPQGVPESNRTPRPAPLSDQAGSTADWTVPSNLPAADYDIEIRATDNSGNQSQWASRRLVLQSDDPLSVEGTVAFTDGTVAAGVQIDLFRQGADGGRAEYLASTTTGNDGRYSFPAAVGCYVLTFVAPDGETFDGSRWFQPATCLEAGETNPPVNATLDGTPGSGGTSIGGTVNFVDGAAVQGVDIDLFEATADGSRGRYLESTSTGAAGSYEFAVAPGCYILTMIAPAGASFSGSNWFQPGACVAADEQIGDVDGVLVAGSEQSGIAGTILRPDGIGAEGANVDLFVTTADGSRGEFLGSDTADSDGAYSFDAPAGCYTLTFTAPDGFSYNGSRWFQPSTCIVDGQQLTGYDATLTNP